MVWKLDLLSHLRGSGAARNVEPTVLLCITARYSGRSAVLLLANPAFATPEIDGYCAGAGQCVYNETNSPTSNNAPSNFGFTVSTGALTGTFSGTATTFSVTATLFSATPWTSGQLDTYLGISASPNSGIKNYLPRAK